VLRWSLVGAVAALVLVVSAARSDSVKRLLVATLDATPAPAAAAQVEVLQPTLDGRDTTRRPIAVQLVPVITGIAQPTDLAFVPGQEDQVVVLSKTGVATWVDLTTGAQRPWLKVDVATTSELGLLGIAFHPNFPTDPRFWLNNTPSRGGRAAATVVDEWRMDDAGAAHRVRTVIEVEQPYQNHDAGQLKFGPDGMLYVAMGDGGFRADPNNAGQDGTTLLGAMLRLDVSGPEPYRVPPDNPYVGHATFRPEIWSTGLRNPWRFTFDPTGRMVIADVGQDAWEEIDLVAPGDNLGWRLREGRHCFDPVTDCPTAGLVDPIYEYGRDDGISVTGGVVWTAPGALQGKYLFADFGTGRIWALDLPEQVRATESVWALGRFEINPSTFVRAPDGTAWIAGFVKGAVYRIQPVTPSSGGTTASPGP